MGEGVGHYNFAQKFKKKNMCHTGYADSLQAAFQHNLCDIYHCYVYSDKLLIWAEELSETCRLSFQK